MTVSSETNKVTYSCDGATTVFPYTFRILVNTDLQVILRTVADGSETTLVLTSAYSVSDVGEATGGNVTTVATYSSAYQLVFRRGMPYTQTTDYIENDPFPAETHEKALDKVTMLTQQLQEISERSVTSSESGSTSYVLPSPVGDKIIGWNTAGDELENKTIVDGVDGSDGATGADGADGAAGADGVDAATATAAFTDANLSSGVYTFNHTIGQFINIIVFDNNDIQVEPDLITATDTNNAAIDLGSFGTITGTWNIRGTK